MAANANIGISIVTGGAVYTPPLSYDPNAETPHRCGHCANPYTGGREDCPNNETRTP